MGRIAIVYLLVSAAGCGGAYSPAGAPQDGRGLEEAYGDEGAYDVAAPVDAVDGFGAVGSPDALGDDGRGGAGDVSGDSAGTPPNLVATMVTSRRGGGGDGERDPSDPIQIPDLPAPLLIYDADLRLEVPAADIVTTLERVVEGAVSRGGYLAGRTNSSVSVRVPSRLFRESLADVEQLGEVTSRRVTAQDVSEEYHDLDVRLRNLRGLRDRLESFLARATTIEEALRVQGELERVAMQIDQAEGRLRYLRSRVAFSLVTIHVDAAPVVVETTELVVEVGPPPPPPPPRLLDLPIEWLTETGLGRLLDLT